MVIPVPVVGAVVGSLVGGLCGAATGQIQGILLGELVEVIDNKIENVQSVKKIKMSESIYEELSGNAPVKEFHVLQHLVVQFKRDILKEENYDHLCGYSTFYTYTVGDEDKKVENGENNDLINDNDYDVFLINENSEEIVDESKIRESMNGVQMNRQSLDELSVDQLSSEINIFMQVQTNE